MIFIFFELIVITILKILFGLLKLGITIAVIMLLISFLVGTL